jgi:hypothetical protein
MWIVLRFVVGSLGKWIIGSVLTFVFLCLSKFWVGISYRWLIIGVYLSSEAISVISTFMF